MAAGFKVVGIDGTREGDDQLVFCPLSLPSNDNTSALGDLDDLDALGLPGAVLFTLGDLAPEILDVSEGLRVAIEGAGEDAGAECEAFGSGVMFVLGDGGAEA